MLNNFYCKGRPLFIGLLYEENYSHSSTGSLFLRYPYLPHQTFGDPADIAAHFLQEDELLE